MQKLNGVLNSFIGIWRGEEDDERKTLNKKKE
jgi:hypothetical protein